MMRTSIEVARAKGHGAILLVGEPVRWHDALALALVIGGIAIAERLGRRR